MALGSLAQNKKINLGIKSAHTPFYEKYEFTPSDVLFKFFAKKRTNFFNCHFAADSFFNDFSAVLGAT